MHSNTTIHKIERETAEANRILAKDHAKQEAANAAQLELDIKASQERQSA